MLGVKKMEEFGCQKRQVQQQSGPLRNRRPSLAAGGGRQLGPIMDVCLGHANTQYLVSTGVLRTW